MHDVDVEVGAGLIVKILMGTGFMMRTAVHGADRFFCVCVFLL